jgi:hypothetical protein
MFKVYYQNNGAYCSAVVQAANSSAAKDVVVLTRKVNRSSIRGVSPVRSQPAGRTSFGLVRIH